MHWDCSSSCDIRGDGDIRIVVLYLVRPAHCGLVRSGSFNRSIYYPSTVRQGYLSKS